MVVSDNTISIDDFKLEKFLGSGAYGAVYLVTKKSSGDLYAMKVIDFSVKVYFINYKKYFFSFFIEFFKIDGKLKMRI